MKTLSALLCLSVLACVGPAPGEEPDRPGPCEQLTDGPDELTAADMPLNGFMLVDGYLCYAPLGIVRQETCTKDALYLACDAKRFTYCPSPKATLSTGVDPLEVRARLYCGADRQAM